MGYLSINVATFLHVGVYLKKKKKLDTTLMSFRKIIVYEKLKSADLERHTCTLLLANDGAVSLLCASDARGCALNICATHFIKLTSSCVYPLNLNDHSLLFLHAKYIQMTLIITTMIFIVV